MVPAIVALSALGSVFRDALLGPSMSNALTTITVAVLLIVLARRYPHAAADSPVRTLGRHAPGPRGVRVMTSPPPNLRVATYNVHACVGTDGRHDPDRVASVVAELEADIVALQEFTYPASVAIESRMPVTLSDAGRYGVCWGRPVTR